MLTPIPPLVHRDLGHMTLKWPWKQGQRGTKKADPDSRRYWQWESCEPAPLEERGTAAQDAVGGLAGTE